MVNILEELFDPDEPEPKYKICPDCNLTKPCECD